MRNGGEEKIQLLLHFYRKNQPKNKLLRLVNFIKGDSTSIPVHSPYHIITTFAKEAIMKQGRREKERRSVIVIATTAHAIFAAVSHFPPTLAFTIAETQFPQN